MSKEEKKKKENIGKIHAYKMRSDGKGLNVINTSRHLKQEHEAFPPPTRHMTSLLFMPFHSFSCKVNLFPTMLCY